MWINRTIYESAREYRNLVFLNGEILLMVAQTFIIHSIFWKGKWDLTDALKDLAQNETDFLLYPVENT